MGKRAAGEGTVFQRKSDGLWVARLRQDDGRKWQGTARTQKEAYDKLQAARTRLQKGLPATEARIKVGQFLETWLTEVVRPRVKPTTYASYDELVRLHLGPGLGNHQLAKLQPAHVQRFLNERLASGLSPRRVQYLHAVLRSALKTAERWHHVRNVAKLVDPPRVPDVEMSPLTPTEAARLLAASRGHRFEHLYAVLLGTGLRLGEALALRWQDVDLSAGRIHVRHTLQRVRGQPWRLVEPKSKTGKRTVPLIGPASSALHAQRARVLETRLRAGSAWTELDFAFPSEVGTPLDGTNVYHEFKKLLRRAARQRYGEEGAVYGDSEEGFGRWLEEHPEEQRFLAHRVHDTRHSTATYLLAAGVPDRLVMGLIGHSQLSMTMRYQHVLPAMLDEAASRLETVFPGAARGA